MLYDCPGRTKIISWPFDWAQHFEPTSHLTDDPLCPLCGEEEDTSLHLLGNCCTIAEKGCEFFGRYFLGPGDLGQEHWRILLRFAKKPVEGFYNLRVKTGGCTLGPLEASALGGKTPAQNGKVR